LLGAFVVLVAVAGVAVESRAQEAPAWRKLRSDAPAEPKGEAYTWKEPDGWTPPSREELEKLKWTDGPIADVQEIGRKRADAIKALATEEEAVGLKNSNDETNRKIATALCRYPKNDDEVDWDATMNRYDSAPTTLNPLLQSSRYEMDMNTLHAAGPWNFDAELKRFADADLVKRWRHGDDVDLLELRDDLTWDDGTPYTAYDIEFSYHVIMDTRVPVPAQRSSAAELKWVKAYDAHTIVYFHKEALPTNIWNVEFSIIPKHIYEHSLGDDPSLTKSEWHVYWNRNPLASGAYRLQRCLSGKEVVFERRVGYWVFDGKKIRS
jgi:peptide/nickel transport system substrate-binding protein